MRGNNNCAICGRELTEPTSVALGIGPICGINLKLKEMKDKSLNLFGNRAKYSWGIDKDTQGSPPILWIKDEGTHERSVTNDIDNILEDIRRETGEDLNRYVIIYRDSMSIWDGITLKGSSVGFYSLNEKEYKQAKEKALEAKNLKRLGESSNFFGTPISFGKITELYGAEAQVLGVSEAYKPQEDFYPAPALGAYLAKKGYTTTKIQGEGEDEYIVLASRRGKDELRVKEILALLILEGFVAFNLAVKTRNKEIIYPDYKVKELTGE